MGELQLAYDSLPLHFQLLPRLGSSTVCPCITVHLPIRSLSTAAASSSSHHALPSSGNCGSIQVVRILDPEHRESFVSLSPLFFAAHLTPLEGLLLFNLQRPDYDTILGGIVPFVDVWVALSHARKIALDLGLADELQAFLDPSSRGAWSLEDKEEGGMIHNWKISNDRIDPSQYSTSRMTSTTFPQIHLLPSGMQVRTLLPESRAASAIKLKSSLLSTSYEELWSKLVAWTIVEYESYLAALDDSSEDEADQSPQMHPTDLTLSSLYSTLLSFLSLTSSIPSRTATLCDPLGSSLSIANGRLTFFQQRHLGNDGGEVDKMVARLGLIESLSRIISCEWRRVKADEGRLRQLATRATEVADLAYKDPEAASMKEKIEEARDEVREMVKRLDDSILHQQDMAARMKRLEDNNRASIDQQLVDELSALRRRVGMLEGERKATAHGDKDDQGPHHCYSIVQLCLPAAYLLVGLLMGYSLRML